MSQKQEPSLLGALVCLIISIVILTAVWVDCRSRPTVKKFPYEYRDQDASNMSPSEVKALIERNYPMEDK
jgi:hypothetical protein